MMMMMRTSPTTTKDTPFVFVVSCLPPFPPRRLSTTTTTTTHVAARPLRRRYPHARSAAQRSAAVPHGPRFPRGSAPLPPASGWMDGWDEHDRMWLMTVPTFFRFVPFGDVTCPPTDIYTRHIDVTT
jgi:hypothetical protein